MRADHHSVSFFVFRPFSLISSFILNRFRFVGYFHFEELNNLHRIEVYGSEMQRMFLLPFSSRSFSDSQPSRCY